MRRLGRLPREVVYFGGIGLYGFGVGILYWLLTREAAGATLLTVFGAGAVTFSAILARAWRSRHVDAEGRALDQSIGPEEEGPGPQGAFGGDPGRIPAESLAPLEVGFGLAVASLSLAFGIWMLVAGIVPFAAGAFAWLRGAERELRGSERDDNELAAPGPSERSAGGPDVSLSRTNPAEPPSA